MVLLVDSGVAMLCLWWDYVALTAWSRHTGAGKQKMSPLSPLIRSFSKWIWWAAIAPSCLFLHMLHFNKGERRSLAAGAINPQNIVLYLWVHSARLTGLVRQTPWKNRSHMKALLHIASSWGQVDNLQSVCLYCSLFISYLNPQRCAKTATLIPKAKPVLT